MKKPDLWQVGMGLGGTCTVGLYTVKLILPQRGIELPFFVGLLLVIGILAGAILILRYSLKARSKGKNEEV